MAKILTEEIIPELKGKIEPVPLEFTLSFPSSQVLFINQSCFQVGKIIVINGLIVLNGNFNQYTELFSIPNVRVISPAYNSTREIAMVGVEGKTSISIQNSTRQYSGYNIVLNMVGVLE